MVGPPSDVKPSGCGLFIDRPLTQRGETHMRWLGDLIVYVMIAAVVGFFIYVAVKSRMEEKKNKPNS